VVFDVLIPITRGQPVLVYSFSNQLSGRVAKLESIVNPKSGESIKKNPRCLMKNQNAVVTIILEERACLELFSNYK
jgi:translation elongation factor EF-1alpha